MSQRLFIRNPEEWDYCFGQSHQIKDHAAVTVVDNGAILPLEPIPEDELPYPVLDIVCRGGVCDDQGAFIAGHQRDLNRIPSNLDCWGAYEIESERMNIRHEEVVFGGILYNHFGHAIADSFTRLWYLISNPNCPKVILLKFPYTFPSSFDAMKLVSLLEPLKSKIEILEVPTRFDRIIIPDEAFVSFGGFMPEFKLPFQAISHAVSCDGETQQSKVYLSRKAYQNEPGGSDKPRIIVNELFFEDFFRRRGYEIVYPEQLPIEEQIRIIHNADDIVSTIGTMTHMLLFSKPTVTATILIRETPMFIQCNIDQACGLEPFYVDAASNPLPVDHAHGPYLMLPNRFFKRYLDIRGITYEDAELECKDKDGLVLKFIELWANTYRQPGATNHHVSDESMFDVIRRMNDTLYDSTFDEDDYRDADRLHPAQLERDELARQLADARRELDELYASKSWKLTKPLRAIVRLLHRE